MKCSPSTFVARPPQYSHRCYLNLVSSAGSPLCQGRIKELQVFRPGCIASGQSCLRLHWACTSFSNNWISTLVSNLRPQVLPYPSRGWCPNSLGGRPLGLRLPRSTYDADLHHSSVHLSGLLTLDLSSQHSAILDHLLPPKSLNNTLVWTSSITPVSQLLLLWLIPLSPGSHPDYMC